MLAFCAPSPANRCSARQPGVWWNAHLLLSIVLCTFLWALLHAQRGGTHDPHSCDHRHGQTVKGEKEEEKGGLLTRRRRRVAAAEQQLERYRRAGGGDGIWVEAAEEEEKQEEEGN